MQAAAYIRVSTEEQTEFSPDAQLRAIRKYCKDKAIALSERHIYKDEGISARTAEGRPAFMQMIAQAKSSPKPFDLILVHRFDRFSRSREDSVVYKSLLRKQCGIRVVSVTEQMQDDKFSIILESMLEAMAEYYSLNLSDEVKKGMTEKALRGELQTPAPFGYRMQNGSLNPEKDTAEMAAEIFRLAASGQHTPATIAVAVNQKGFRTKKGNPFSGRAIRYILQNPIYRGDIRWHPGKKGSANPSEVIVTKGNHLPLVSAELWHLANRQICQRSGRRSSRHPSQWPDLQQITPPGYGSAACSLPAPASPQHFLDGLLHCAHCGSRLYRTGKKSAPLYRCGGYLNGSCPKPQGISAAKIEQIVRDALAADYEQREVAHLDATLSPPRQPGSTTSPPHDSQYAILLARVKEIRYDKQSQTLDIHWASTGQSPAEQ